VAHAGEDLCLGVHVVVGLRAAHRCRCSADVFSRRPALLGEFAGLADIADQP
jgi:hypothetical protein